MTSQHQDATSCQWSYRLTPRSQIRRQAGAALPRCGPGPRPEDCRELSTARRPPLADPVDFLKSWTKPVVASATRTTGRHGVSNCWARRFLRFYIAGSPTAEFSPSPCGSSAMAMTPVWRQNETRSLGQNKWRLDRTVSVCSSLVSGGQERDQNAWSLWSRSGHLGNVRSTRRSPRRPPSFRAHTGNTAGLGRVPGFPARGDDT